jgi:transposase
MKDESLENNIVSLHARGWSIRQLASNFDISRGRVGRILKRNHYQRETGNEYQIKPANKVSILDPYKDYIKELLETYKDPPPTGQRVFELIREKGYPGGRTIVNYYLADVRGKQTQEPVICVETPAGQRGSHDWSEYYVYLSDKGEKEKVIFFSFILNYSRRQYIEVVEDKTQTSLFQCLINTFVYFDGVPREIKSDNQKACVDRWESGKPVFNKTFLEFASHYCFTPLTIHPGKPRENLKIERPFYYLEKNFLNARKFYHSEDLKEQLAEWLLGVNDQRIHRTTRQKPVDLYRKEFPSLQALPRKQYDTSVIEHRVVNSESCIEWERYYYVVPRQYMYETCPVRKSNMQIIIYGPGSGEIIRYPLAAKDRKNRYIGRKPQNRNKTIYPQTKEMILRLEALNPIMAEYIIQIKKHKKVTWRHHITRVLSLKVNYHKEDIIMAVRRALKYKVYEAGSIENFLSVNAQKKNEIKLFPRNRTTDEK